MITDRKTFREYCKQDIRAHGLEHVGLYDYLWRDCLRFQLRLRRLEYLYNTMGRNIFKRLSWFLLEILHHHHAIRLGFTIPKNVFGAGLCIVHHGTIVVSPNAKVGAYCRLHPSTCIGDYNGAPTLGDNVYIGPGAKIYGPISLGDNVAVGANSVVNKSFGNNLTLAGAPAHIVVEYGALEQGVYPSAIT